MKQNKSYHILTVVMLLLLVPSALSARKHKAAMADTSVLDFDQQQYFDSLYIHALALNNRGMEDSAFVLMQEAVDYYDSMLNASGYHIPLSVPGLPADPLPKGMKSPTTRQVPGLAAAYYWLSTHYRKQGDALHSILTIETAVAIDSVNYWYTEAEGSLFLALKQYEEAQVCFERLVRNYPQKSDPLYSMAQIYVQMDSIDQCIATLNRLEELEGINPNMTQYKYSLLERNGRGEEGLDEYRKLIARYPYNVQYRIQLGDLQMQNGQIQQAKLTYDQAAAIEPDNAYVWVAEANYYSMTGNQEAADTLVASALVNANLDVETKVEVMEEYLKGSYRKLSQYREQVEKGSIYSVMDTMALFGNVDSLFSEVAAMHPTEADIYELQAQWRHAMGQDSLASDCMRFAVDLKPTSQEFWERMLVYATYWMPKERIVELTQECLEQHPGDQAAYSIAAWAYVNLDQKLEAIGQYRQAIEHMTPPDANQVSQLWGNIGDLYYQLDSLDQTWDCYEKAVRYNPTNYSVLNNYAYYLSEARKDLTKAEQMSLKVIQKYPDNPTYLDTYAWILYLEGSYPLAIFYQQHALDCLPAGDTSNSTLYDHFGDMKVKSNDLQGAVEMWRKALECDDCDNRADIEKKIESAEVLMR